jgi:hypothetical protein
MKKGTGDLFENSSSGKTAAASAAHHAASRGFSPSGPASFRLHLVTAEDGTVTKIKRCIYTPHSLRATTATLLLDAGVDIIKVGQNSRVTRGHLDYCSGNRAFNLVIDYALCLALNRPTQRGHRTSCRSGVTPRLRKNCTLRAGGGGSGGFLTFLAARQV